MSYILLLLPLLSIQLYAEEILATPPSSEEINKAIMASLGNAVRAMEGDPEAQYQQGLNNIFMHDNKKALEWFQLAANQGHKAAMYYTGIAYLNGDGVAKDPRKAATLLQQAAEAGIPEAQAAMGTLSYTGLPDVLTADPNTAFQWYLKAAQNGNKQGQYNVAYCYYQGIGTSASQFAEAYAWAKIGSEPAQGQTNDPQAAQMVQYLDSVFNEDGKKFSLARYDTIKAEVAKATTTKK